MAAKWREEKIVPVPKRYHAIFCFTCKKTLPGKSAVKGHLGHSVEYVDKNGFPED